MKKILILICLVLFLTACTSKQTIKEESKEGIVIQHFVRNDNDLDNDYNIEVYSDKKIVYSYLSYDGFEEIKLSDNQYEELINYAFSSKLLSLDENISSDKSGVSSYVVLYFEDGTIFKTGGINPNNKNYKKVITMLNNYFK